MDNKILQKQGDTVIQPEPLINERTNRIQELLAEMTDEQKPLFMEALRQEDKKFYTPDFVYAENYPKHNRSLFSESYGDEDLFTGEFGTEESTPDNRQAYIKNFDKELQAVGKLLKEKQNNNLSGLFESEVFSPYFDEIQESLKLYHNNFNRFPTTLEELVTNKQIDYNYY